MEYRTLVHRILGVPDIIQVQHRTEAAARKLLQRAALPLDDDHIKMGRTVISLTLMMCEDGQIDALWGGWQSVPDTSAQLLELLPAEMPARGAARNTAEILFEQMREYIMQNPHSDSPGPTPDPR